MRVRLCHKAEVHSNEFSSMNRYTKSEMLNLRHVDLQNRNIFGVFQMIRTGEKGLPLSGKFQAVLQEEQKPAASP